MINNSPIIVYDETDEGDVALKFRSPSNTELVQFRDAALISDQELIEEIISGLCLYPSDEKGVDWFKQLAEDDFIKYRTILGLVTKQVIEKLKVEYDIKLETLLEEIEKKQQTAISCYKSLITYLRTGKPSVESDVALIFIHKALLNMANFRL